MKTKTPQFRLTSGLKNFKFDLKRGKGHLFSYFINRIRWHLLPRLHHVSKFPSHVDVELSSLCNLNCPMCYTTTEKFKTKVDGGNMTFDLYKKIIDECAKYNLYSIRLSLRGESFLNKNIYDMIKYAKEKGINIREMIQEMEVQKTALVRYFTVVCIKESCLLSINVANLHKMSKLYNNEFLGLFKNS